ncbi:hypothetical protein LTS08_008705 [Lithohypha guttulata]|nr:hypothetical protein LTS08_008705 [Lithohypha guttulata]
MSIAETRSTESLHESPELYQGEQRDEPDPLPRQLHNYYGSSAPSRKERTASNNQDVPQAQDDPLGKLSLSSPLLAKLASYGCDQYGSIATFLIDNPAVWNEDQNQLQRLILEHVRRDKPDPAKRLAHRLAVFTLSRKKNLATASERQEWLTKLNTRGRLRGELEGAAERILQQLIQKAGTQEVTQQDRESGAVRTADESQNLTRDNTGHTRSQRYLPTNNATHNTSLTFQQSVPNRSARSSLVSSLPGGLITDAALVTTSPPMERKGSFRTLPSDIDSVSGGPAHYGLFGPRSTIVGALPKQVQDRLHDEYRVHHGKAELDKVFGLGCIFAAFWHENYGLQPGQNVTDSLLKVKSSKKGGGHVTKLANGEIVYSHIRRFLVVRPRKGFCLALPITSYSGKGLSAKKIDDREHNSHCIIYDHKNGEGRPQYVPNEAPFVKDAVAVNMVQGETLKPSSRLCYARPTPIEYNIKVKAIGRIINAHLPRVRDGHRVENFDEY